MALAASLGACKGGSDDPCDGVGCSSRGFCIADQGNAYCACITGFHPVLLDCVANDSTDTCLGIICSGHGTCREVPDGVTCDCRPGYHLLGLDDPLCADLECDLICVPDRPGDADADADGDADSSDEADWDGEADTGDTGCSIEICDGLDNDCDTATDEECSATVGTPCTGDATCTGGYLVCNENWGICVVAGCTGQPNFQPCEAITAPDRSYDICVRESCVSPGCGDASCNAPGPNGPLNDTAQRTCYDSSAALASCPGTPGTAGCETADFCGQDAQYGWDAVHAATERFTRTGATEPIVTDNVTELAWQGCSRGQTGSSCTGTATTADWSTALSYCDSLVWGGFSDWRLPSEFELQSIFDYGAATAPPRIDLAAFPATPADYFWSSSSNAANASDAWYLYFWSGFSWVQGKTAAIVVRCVRAGSRVSLPRFARTEPTAGSPLVADSATGLVWQGCPAGMTGDVASCTGTALTPTWQAALDYCQDSTWGGYTDWYLPSVNELRSIADNGRVAPAIDTVAFPGTPSRSFWSSSSFAAAPDDTWGMSFDGGLLTGYLKTETYHARCARRGP